MAAPKGNKNANKWTRERVIYYLNRVEKRGREGFSLFWGQELVRMGLYKDLWQYWRRRFGEDEQVIYQMDIIETLYEGNLFKAGLLGRMPAWLCMICLRNINGWKVQKHPKPSDDDQVKVSAPKMEPEPMARAA
jgi:hypothetical protein